MSSATGIVVSGIGLISPLGENRETSWRCVIHGGGAAPHDTAAVPWAAPDGIHRTAAFALKAAREALADGRFSDDKLDERWGCTVSSSKPLISRAPFAVAAPDEVTRAVAQEFHIPGPCLNIAAACATGPVAVALGAQWILRGQCDYVLAGASESSLDPLYLAGFSQMGVLSPGRRARPFDKNRDGFIIGEGAAVFLLEREATAMARGATPYGVLNSWDLSADASHAVRMNSEGAHMADCLRRAMKRARLAPRDVGYVNAHGTATVLNDRLETQALTSVFSDGGAPLVSSTKGATGHLLGATGAVELAFTLLAMRDGRLPPTLHLESPLTDRFDFIPKESRRATVRHAATLSFGFGGSLAALVVSQ